MNGAMKPTTQKGGNTMKINETGWNEYQADGLIGKYSLSKKMGGWTHIHYIVGNDDGIGCKIRQFVGTVSRENFGSEEFPPCHNPQFRQQVEEAILAHAKKLHEEDMPA
jgi:hypothetical protein